MYKKLSPFDDKKINDVLDHIFAIAKMSKDAALIETDKLLSDIFKESEYILAEELEEDGSDFDDESGDYIEYNEDYYRNKFLEFIKDISMIVDKVRNKQIIERIDIFKFEKEYYFHCPEQYKKKLVDVVKESKNMVDMHKKEVFAYYYIQELGLLDDIQITQFGTTQRIIKEIKNLNDLYSKYIGKNQKISELEMNLKKKAIITRSMRKLDQAEILKAGGSTKRYQTLRNEAVMILKQDWKYGFPDDQIPDIDDLYAEIKIKQ